MHNSQGFWLGFCIFYSSLKNFYIVDLIRRNRSVRLGVVGALFLDRTQQF